MHQVVAVSLVVQEKVTLCPTKGQLPGGFRVSFSNSCCNTSFGRTADAASLSSCHMQTTLLNAGLPPGPRL